MASTLQSSSWADLQLEPLGLVLTRLPSLADRVRLRAVCRPWRSIARLQPVPPPLPWLTLLDGTFLSISDAEIHCMPSPNDASSHGSIDNWLFLKDSNGGCSLMNPFSKTTLQLPKLANIWHDEMENAYDSAARTCHPPIATDSFIFHDFPFEINTYDIAYCGGNLYALSASGKLYILDISEGHEGKSEFSYINCIV